MGPLLFRAFDEKIDGFSNKLSKIATRYGADLKYGKFENVTMQAAAQMVVVLGLAVFVLPRLLQVSGTFLLCICPPTPTLGIEITIF